MTETKDNSKDISLVFFETDSGDYERCYATYSDLFTLDLNLGKCNNNRDVMKTAMASYVLDVYTHESLRANSRITAPGYRVYRANVDTLGQSNDMTSLTYLEEPNMLQCLQLRYDADDIYTNVANVLIAINPYRQLGIYTQKHMDKYRGVRRLDLLPPHIFALAEKVFQNLRQMKENQSVICCGESGSGKTESTKMLLRYLAMGGNYEKDLHDHTMNAEDRVHARHGSQVSKIPASPAAKTPGGSLRVDPAASPSTKKAFSFEIPTASATTVEKQVLQANPVFEAFGNARTNMNDNSSRFAKFTKLFVSNQFNRIVGAITETYLLEKSRVIKQSKGERNYHIFYMLAAGYKSQMDLDDASKFNYLNGGGVLTLKDVSDADKFNELCTCMDTMGFGDTQESIFRVVAGIMYLGNVEFLKPAEEKSSRVGKITTAKPGVTGKGAPISGSSQPGSILHPNSEYAIGRAAEFLGVEESRLTSRLTTRRIEIRGKESYVKTMEYDEAFANRDAIAKELYHALFQHIVAKINEALFKIDDMPEENMNWIGVLDIFGFEVFQTNSFEQFCINFANEKLQNFFNFHILKSEQAEYRKEGIFWTPINIQDNTDVVTLIQSKPSGILCLLDSACIMPNGSQDTFVNNLFAVHGQHARLTAANPPSNIQKSIEKAKAYRGFQISHFAARVTYDAEHFLVKNAGSTHPDTIELFSDSASDLIKGLFAVELAILQDAEKTGNRFISVGSTFSKQLISLMDTLQKTSPYFVRCASPNPDQAPKSYKWKYLQPQLRCGGLKEALRVLKFGYPTRVKYDVITEKYGNALNPRPVNLNARNFCEAILVAFGLARSQYQLGLTKVFFRPGKQEFLQSIFRRSDEPLTPEIEAAIRKWLVRRRIQRACASVRVYNTFANRLKHIRIMVQFRKAVRRAVLFKKVVKFALRARRLKMIRANAIVHVQRWWRHYRNRRKMVKALNIRIKKSRMNKIRGIGVMDGKTAEELNVLRVQMQAAKKREEQEKKKLEDFKQQAVQKEIALQKTLEEEKTRLMRMQLELSQMKTKDEAFKEQQEMVKSLKSKTDALRLESENAARQAKLIMQAREKEYQQQQAELLKLKAESDRKQKENEEKAAELAKKAEEERRQRENDLKELNRQTELLRQEKEIKAKEAQELLRQREELNKKKEEELAKMQQDAEKQRQSHAEETAELIAQRELEKARKEEEQRALQADIARIKMDMEAEALQAKLELEAREAENQRKQQELQEMKQQSEKMKHDQDLAIAALKAQREFERQQREEALKQFEEDSRRAKEEHERQAAAAAQALREREEENRRKEAMLKQQQAEAEQMRLQHEQQTQEAQQLLKKQEEEAQQQMLALRTAAQDAARAYEEEQKRIREEAANELATKLSQTQSENQSAMDQMKAQYEEQIKKLHLLIIERDEALEQMHAEALEASEAHDLALGAMKHKYHLQELETRDREAKITKLLDDLEKSRLAAEEVNTISQRLLAEQQEEMNRRTDQANDDIAKLKQALARTTQELMTLRRDHEDLVMVTSKDMYETKKAGKGPTGDENKEEKRPAVPDMLKTNIVSQWKASDFIHKFGTRQGWLVKRRPGNILGRARKTRYILLDGLKLSWFGDTDIKHKPKGVLDLKDYEFVKYDDKLVKLYAAAGAGNANFNAELRLVPIKGGASDTLILQMPQIDPSVAAASAAASKTPVDPKGHRPSVLIANPESIMDWIYDINRRIAVARYLDANSEGDQKDKSSADERTISSKVCRELVEFVSDTSQSTLCIENKLTDVHGALSNLWDALACRSGFTRLILNNVALTDQSVKMVSDIIGRNESIQEVQLMNNVITSTGAAHLANAFKENQSVQILRMDYNNLQDAGAIFLASALKTHKKLIRLSLSHNNITDKGAIQFIDGLIACGATHQFPAIELGHNVIENGGAQAVAKLLDLNKNILSVDLGYNLVGDDGVTAIVQALKNKKTGLRDLVLPQNQITNKSVIALSDALSNLGRELLVDVSNNILVTRTGVASLVSARVPLQFKQLKVYRSDENARSASIADQNDALLTSIRNSVIARPADK